MSGGRWCVFTPPSSSCPLPPASDLSHTTHWQPVYDSYAVQYDAQHGGAPTPMPFIAEPGSDMDTEVPTPAKRARKGAALTPAEERAVRLEKRKAAARS